MKKNKLNEQEEFWIGKFGNDYIKRNNSNSRVDSNFFLFKKIFNDLEKPKDCIELRANIGLNLKALKNYFLT